jgi:hypothetical protein
MKRWLRTVPLALVATCGGSDNPATKDPTLFLGVPWRGSVTTSLNCPGQFPIAAPTTFNAALSSASGADLQYTSAAGCTYLFKIIGNIASLANTPVSCTVSVAGLTGTATWTSYSLSTGDGHNLGIAAAGTASVEGEICPFTQVGSATR